MNETLPNSITVTREYCAGTKNKLVFRPETMDEAVFVVAQLRAMGYDYYNAEYAQRLEDTLTGSIYLDTDKTIMVTANRDTDGIDCPVNSFEAFYIPEVRTESRLTEDDVRRCKLLFYPRSVGEARAIMGLLMAHGAALEDESQKGPLVAARAVTQGVLVTGGKVRFAPTADDVASAQICTAADLGVNPVSHLSAEQITIMAAFNEMAARMGQLSARIARLEAEILPGEIDKGATTPKSLAPPKKTPKGGPS